MMDTSITLVSPEMHFDRGYAAFRRGESINGHNMNPGAPAITDWQRGYRASQMDSHAELACLHAMEGTPP